MRAPGERKPERLLEAACQRQKRRRWPRLPTRLAAREKRHSASYPRYMTKRSGDASTGRPPDPGSQGAPAAQEWRVSRRFLREYQRASPRLQSLAEHEVQHMQLVAASRKDWTAQWRRLKGIRRETVLELELGGGPRLLAHVGDGVVTLLAMGDHEITTRYSREGNPSDDLARSQSLPAVFVAGRHSSFFPPVSNDAPSTLVTWWPERASDWLYFLDEEQMGVCERLVESIEAALADEETYTVQFIVGGPGTGKTSILLQLLKRLSDQVVVGQETWSVGLAVSDRVAQYITASTGWCLDVSRELAREFASVDILLVDDPRSEEQIARFVRTAQRLGPLRAVIVAFDPLQLSESLTDADYRRMVDEHNAGEERLRSSYRQKEIVGRYALEVATTVAASSPFLDDQKQRRYAKERRKLTNRANFLRFPNPSGHTATHPDATLADWRTHVAWIAGQTLLWTHWPPLLVIVDDDTSLPPPWLDELEKLNLRHELIRLSELEQVKGLEYQHVALVLSSVRHHDLQRGFSGSGRRLYNDYRMLRIPFTRAKDSVAVFVHNR